jgi:hypothetical protein
MKVLLLALASASQTCIMNGTDQALALLVQQWMSDDVHLKFIRSDIAPHETFCFSTVSDSDKPFTLIVARPNEVAENPYAKPRCPDVRSGESARFVVTASNDTLVCKRVG